MSAALPVSGPSPASASASLGKDLSRWLASNCYCVDGNRWIYAGGACPEGLSMEAWKDTVEPLIPFDMRFNVTLNCVGKDLRVDFCERLVRPKEIPYGPDLTQWLEARFDRVMGHYYRYQMAKPPKGYSVDQWIQYSLIPSFPPDPNYNGEFSNIGDQIYLTLVPKSPKPIPAAGPGIGPAAASTPASGPAAAPQSAPIAAVSVNALPDLNWDTACDPP